MLSENTRFKLAIGCLALYLAEGLIKALLPGFPIEVVVGAEGFIVVYYFTTKTVDNVQTVKFTQAALPFQTKPPCPEPPK